jgi:predicted metallopeptidase
LAQLHFGVTRARKDRKHGLQAKITPMRFPGGERIRRRYGRWYCVQRYWLEGTELLYLMTFCMPRFLNQGFDEKLVTIFHELFHIAPEFNGDLRWHEGRYRVHTRSQKKLDTEMAGLAREYLNGGADPGLHAFLRLSFDELIARHGRIVCLALPMPKLVPVG